MKKFFQKLKEKWKRYLERMAESNKKLYGEKRLDCCDMNKEDHMPHAKTHEH